MATSESRFGCNTNPSVFTMPMPQTVRATGRPQYDEADAADGFVRGGEAAVVSVPTPGRGKRSGIDLFGEEPKAAQWGGSAPAPGRSDPRPAGAVRTAIQTVPDGFGFPSA
ncbi:hypothetical protein Airi02_010920 [Actinoallomurus iriomotensis]|uniref:Uncharacterized protein n=1 Tax=Actinoallomurus iriomotensis TaxID=478107 RepID=A0A9W6RZZ4_9ACTN|nr:hypothetical protein Airi02_010920 [Actinoallomurus iriomotensis]